MASTWAPSSFPGEGKKVTQGTLLESTRRPLLAPGRIQLWGIHRQTCLWSRRHSPRVAV